MACSILREKRSYACLAAGAANRNTAVCPATCFTSFLKHSSMHFETLTEKGKQIFSALDSFKEFYLAGGTALALYIGHRQSFDFDLFSDKEIPASLLSRVKKIFADTPVSPAVNNKEELTVFVGAVKIT